MRRYCYLCDSEIFECMGSVHAGSFLAYIFSGEGKVYELCPKCASKAANSLSDYPNPHIQGN